MGGSNVVRSSTSPSKSSGLDDVQRKRMEARRKMQMQMEYDAPGRGKSYVSAGGSGGNDTRYRQITKSYSSHSEATLPSGNKAGETVLEDLNKLSGYLKERKEQQAREGSAERLGGHRASPPRSGASGPKTVSSFMKDRGY
jgi:hypothetical protein